MSDESVTIDDLRETEDHDEDESDMDVVFDEFEALIGNIKTAMFMLQSKRDVPAAVGALRDATMRATDLQSAVLDYMAGIEDGDEDEGEDEGEEDAPDASEDSDTSESQT